MHASIDGRGLAYAQKWVQAKLLEMATFLKKLQVTRKEEAVEQAINFITTQAEKLEKATLPPETIRGLEGSASRFYFQTIGQLLPEKFQFTHRSPSSSPRLV